MISVDDLLVELGGHRVLTDVSLEVADGEFLAVVGPNGAGKSTLLRTMGGLVSPAAGSVRVDGRDVVTLSARETARLVASVPQSASFGFDFTVREVVEMGRTPYRTRLARAPDPDGPRQVKRALARTETATLADRSVTTLSGGERQRVLLARALAQEAPCLLLDEPTASLDINHQVRTLDLIGGLEETVVAAVHDLDLAARYCDRVAVVAGGELQAVGTPRSVFQPDLLESVFGVSVAVEESRVTGAPSITALSNTESSETI